MKLIVVHIWVYDIFWWITNVEEGEETFLLVPHLNDLQGCFSLVFFPPLLLRNPTSVTEAGSRLTLQVISLRWGTNNTRLVYFHPLQSQSITLAAWLNLGCRSSVLHGEIISIQTHRPKSRSNPGVGSWHCVWHHVASFQNRVRSP